MSFDAAHCTLCPRRCGADREKGVGLCHCDTEIRIARAALHPWEEPCISGRHGSGTVFFSGCALGCVFCQNRKISRQAVGKAVTVTQLAEIFLKLHQDIHSGGSGCGCSASVFAGYVYRNMKEGKIRRALIVSTGAMLSTISPFQGESIPGIAHAISLESVSGIMDRQKGCRK